MNNLNVFSFIYRKLFSWKPELKLNRKQINFPYPIICIYSLIFHHKYDF